jgi:hypothetical protein
MLLEHSKIAENSMLGQIAAHEEKLRGKPRQAA